MADDQVATRQAIADALRRFADGDIAAESEHLLGVLGYRSERTISNQTGEVDSFLTDHPALNPDTKTEAEFRGVAKSIHLIFQVTDEEIAAEVQQSLFTSNDFDRGIVRSFLFVAVELSGNNYPRGKYAEFTREINKRFTMPVVLLFRAADGSLTAAFVHRRIHKRDAGRDVLGSVSLIREIDSVDPHRAHIDILEELTLDKRLRWIGTNRKPQNFDGLLAAWLDALDTETLNKRFYRELFEWFGRACDTALFPTGGAKALPPEEHVIRLITRLLFVWFIKEKGLVAEDLFVENQAERLLKDYDRERGDSYYRAVLQNLFFATLNTEIQRRGFSSRSNATHRDFSRYRYAAEMADQNALQALFDCTPFINGGLFDCLDSELAPRDGGYRIDYFTDNVIRPGAAEYQQLSVPNRLFFDANEKAPGLITLFNRYKFTVEENTPVEQEVALDPELLGKVFENLLAANTPETQESARKQTGSYYTPRPVVDYMVEEALTASLLERVKPDDAGEADIQWWRDRLLYLFDYDDEFNDASELFDEVERDAVVRAIAETTVLDPAVGSGAFPMGVLHKLTLALRRLDEKNERWEQFQRELALQRSQQAYDLTDQHQRDDLLTEISATFQRYRDSDFGRKLYLIQNSIFGVDIQAIATQIAKLRFFISLAIEQEPTDDPDENYGIQPLPNLETRFVAADTLLGLDRPLEPTFGDHAVTMLQQQLAANRERHFHAANRSDKLRFRQQDGELRRQLADALRKADFSADTANKIAQWDPYNQNSNADWFDPEWMFGLKDGFDIVIGNPPYVESRNSLLSDEQKVAYLKQVRLDWNTGISRGSDLLVYFFARSAKVLHPNGTGCLITQNAWLSTDYGKAFQSFTAGRFSFQRIIDTSAKFFANPDGPQINAVLAFFIRSTSQHIEHVVADRDMALGPNRMFKANTEMKWGHLFSMPPFFAHILTELSELEDSNARQDLRFGQGINIARSRINGAGAKLPLIDKGVYFVATSADAMVRKSDVSAARLERPPALVMPRGIGERFFCTFNQCKAFSYSGVELYIHPSDWESDLHYCLWAYLNSSFAWLFREITGRKNLGGGMLKAEATDMKGLPIAFPFNFGAAARHAFEELKEREPLPVQAEIRTTEHLDIDNMVAAFFGLQDYSESVRETLVGLVAARTSRARANRRP